MEKERCEKMEAGQPNSGTGIGLTTLRPGRLGDGHSTSGGKTGTAGFLGVALTLLLDELNLSLARTKEHPWGALQWTRLSSEYARDAGAEDRNFRNTLRKKCLSFDPVILLVGISPKDIKMGVKISLQKCSLFITVKEWKLFL